MAQAGVKKPAVDIIKVDGCKDYTSIKYLDELNKRQRVSGWCDAASAAFAIGYNCSWCDCFSMHMPISCSHAKSIASSNDALNPPVILVENPWWRRCCTFSEPLFTLLLLCDWQSHPNDKITLQRPTYRNIYSISDCRMVDCVYAWRYFVSSRQTRPNPWLLILIVQTWPHSNYIYFCHQNQGNNARLILIEP